MDRPQKDTQVDPANLDNRISGNVEDTRVNRKYHYKSYGDLENGTGEQKQADVKIHWSIFLENTL